jgi:hypothetical protein
MNPVYENGLLCQEIMAHSSIPKPFPIRFVFFYLTPIYPSPKISFLGRSWKVPAGVLLIYPKQR